MRKFLRLLAAALAFFGAIGTASADVMTFENPDTTYAPFAPLLGHTDALVEGDYAVQMFSTLDGAQQGDLVGALVGPGSCFSVQCPSNNSTGYLGSLNDAVPEFSRLDGGLFNFTQFDASFLGAEGVPIGSPISMALILIGVDAFGVETHEQIALSGLSFATYAPSASFANTAFKFVDVYSFACNGAICNRSMNLAQVGFDNVTFATPVPEPSTWALLGLGLIGIAVIRRRATAKA